MNPLHDSVSEQERHLAQAVAASQKDDVAAARHKVIAAKLGGLFVLADALPYTADEAELTAFAEKLAAKLNIAPAQPGKAIDPASLNPYDRLQHAIGQQRLGHGNRLGTAESRSTFAEASKPVPVRDGAAIDTPYERLDRVVTGQLRAMGLAGTAS